MPTVLIADDNIDLRETLGLNVLAAADGEEAWEMLLQKNVDVVLSDVSMPRLDGVALCKRVGVTPCIAHIPFILMSGNPPSLKPAHAFGIITKPVPLDVLLFTLNKSLQRTSPQHCLVFLNRP